MANPTLFVVLILIVGAGFLRSQPIPVGLVPKALLKTLGFACCVVVLVLWVKLLVLIIVNYHISQFG